MESLKETRGLVITFVKRIFQSAVPVSMTLIHNTTRNEDQLLIADTEMKFKLFDKNTFEILATFLGPIYDSNVKQFVSIYGTAIQMEFQWSSRLKDPLSSFFSAITHPILLFYLRSQDSSTSLSPTTHSKFFIFSTNKSICLYTLPIDGNPFRSLGIVGHCDGVKSIKTNSTRQVLFSIGNKCQSLFAWSINLR